MQHGSIPLKPIGKPPPYPPPQCISSLAARTAHNESYPADLCAAVVLARIDSSKEKKKEMERLLSLLESPEPKFKVKVRVFNGEGEDTKKRGSRKAKGVVNLS